MIMPTSRECLCCHEITLVANKIALAGTKHVLQCITEHPGFSTVCLDVWVLQTAYFQYQQQYGVQNGLNEYM